jgi:hypothetical protein
VSAIRISYTQAFKTTFCSVEHFWRFKMSRTVERRVPNFIEGYGKVHPFTGVTREPETLTRAAVQFRSVLFGRSKRLQNIAATFKARQWRDLVVSPSHAQWRSCPQHHTEDAFSAKICDRAALPGTEFATLGAPLPTLANT